MYDERCCIKTCCFDIVIAIVAAVLTLALGYAHPCVYELPAGITVVIGETPDRNPLVTVSGASKHMVGQVASDLKHFYPVEPYKGKGVRIHGEFVRRKEGKKTA